jgi:F-type H+-transporting ATPase subunit b
MDERNKVIESGIKYADEMKLKLEKAQQESEAILRKAALDAQAVVTDARKSAKDLLEKQTQDAAAQGAAILDKAHQSIELERKKMLAEVRAEIARLVTLTTAKVLSKELTPEERSRFANAASRELTNV